MLLKEGMLKKLNNVMICEVITTSSVLYTQIKIKSSLGMHSYHSCFHGKQGSGSNLHRLLLPMRITTYAINY